MFLGLSKESKQKSMKNIKEMQCKGNANFYILSKLSSIKGMIS